jgi:hypothetical protein
LLDYLDKKGRFNILKFFSDHKAMFLLLFVIAQREASHRIVEVGCRRFFGPSGYESATTSTRELQCNYEYERIAMLTTILRMCLLIPKKVAKEYLN